MNINYAFIGFTFKYIDTPVLLTHLFHTEFLYTYYDVLES